MKFACVVNVSCDEKLVQIFGFLYFVNILAFLLLENQKQLLQRKNFRACFAKNSLVDASCDKETLSFANFIIVSY